MKGRKSKYEKKKTMRERSRPTMGKTGGDSALDAAMQREEEKAKQRWDARGPKRFFLAKGEECEVIILDESLEDAFWRQEHTLAGADGKYNIHEPCIADQAPCPRCAEGNRSGLVVFVTALIMREYKSKKTGETVDYSKMLIPIKRGQYKAWRKVEGIAIKKHGTFRGTSLLLERADEQNSASTGEPVANEDGNLVNDWLSEDDLIKEFGHPEKKGREAGVILKRANEDITPVDYEKIFPPPDIDAILDEAKHEVPGRRRREKEPEKEHTSSRRSRRSQQTEEEEQPEKEEELAGSRRRRRTDEEEEEDNVPGLDAEPEAEEEEKPKTRARSRGRKPADADDEPDFSE